MAAKTFQELYTDALTQIDELTGSNAATAKTIVKAGINEAYAEAAGIRDWKTLENNTTITTASGTEEYTPIASSTSTPRIRRIQSIKDETNKVFLGELQREVFEQSYPYVDTSTDTGKPKVWYVSGYDSNRDIKVKLYYVPDGTYTLRVVFYEEPLALSGDSDEPRIPDQFHYGLTYLGIAKYFEFYKDPMGTYYRQLHEQFKNKIETIEWGDTDEMPAFRTEEPAQAVVTGKIGRIYNR